MVRFTVGNLEGDRDLRKKRLEGQRFEITARIEAQTIDPGRSRASVRHQRPLASIGIRFSPPDDLPSGFMLPLEDDPDAGGRDPAGCIEDVGGDRAHEWAILA